MSQRYEFPPAIFKLAYQDDDQARTAFMSAVTKMTSEAQSRFDAAFTHVGSMLQKTFSSFQSSNYRLDLDTSSLRQAATEATYAEERLKQLRDAAMKLAEVTGDRSQQTQAYVQALRAQATAAGEAAREAQEQVRIYTSLQQTVDGLTAKNKALADSYRATFAEQARAANRANEAQKTFNSFAAPGIDNRAINNGAGYSALAELARQQDEAEKAAAAMAQLRSAEEAAARGSDLVAATYRNTALGIDAMSKSARESAAVFEQMFAEQEKAAKAQAELAQSAMQLRREMDPTLAIQQKFDAEMSRADDLLRAGAISQREYAEATSLARQNLQSQHAALFQTAEAAKQGTTANHMMVNSVRSQRVAMVQAGQQMQDMAIQFQMGTKASTIMAQQLPQLGFALSGLDGNANKALSRLGQFGTFIAGPWGAALTIGLVALSPFIDKLFESGEEADKASKRHRTLSEVLMDQKASIKEVIEASEEYIRTQEKAREVDILAIATTADQIALNLKEAASIREKIAAELERQQAFATSPENMKGGPDAMAVIQAGIQRSEAALAQQQAKIDSLSKDANEVAIQAASAAADLMTDPEKRLKTGFEIMRKQVKESGVAVDVMRGKLADLNRQETLALDTLRKTRNESSSAMKAATEAAFTSPLASYKVTSGFLAQRNGYKHQGIDMAAPMGTPIYAPQAGIVDFAGTAGNYGNLLKVGHGGGTETRYGHLSKLAVQKGQAVEQGDVLGYVGSTGRSTGPHLHYEVRVNGKLADPSKGKFPIDAAKVAEEAQKAADTLQRFGDSAVNDISRINAQFDEAPRLIDQAAAATAHLNDLIADLSSKKPVGWERMVADAQVAKGTIEDALVRPYRELTQESERRIEIESLLASGREDEADALRMIWQLENRLGPITDQRKAAILDQVKYERQITDELRARQAVIGMYLDASRSVKQELVSIFSGNGGDIQKVFKQLNSQVIVEKIFGPMFRDLDKWVKEQSGVTSSVDFFATETKRAGGEAKSFADDLNAARLALSSGSVASKPASAFDAAFAPMFGGAAAAANDNSLGGILQRIQEQSTNEILVVGNKIAKHVETTANNLTPDLFARRIGSEMAKTLGDTLPGVFGGQAAQGILGGAIYGNMVGGAPGAILGGLGGIPGLPTGLADLFSSGLQGLSGASLITDIASSFGIKIPGEAKYGLLTGLLKKIFGGAKYGNASFQDGVMSVNGNNGDLKTGAQTSGDNLLSTLNQIADSLGATLGAFNVSLGQTDGKWRISSTGRTGELKSKYSDVQVFGTGDAAYQQALEAAIRDAISDGAIKGISQAAQNILKAGGDLQKAIEKAALVQSIPKQLKQMTDPVGYAIDELNAEFTKVVDALKLGSASAAEFADAEKLYGLKRAEAIKQAGEQMTGALRSLYEDLTIGNESLSLRDRKSAASAKYDPLAARVAAGDSTAYADYVEAARTMLDIERQISGSQGDYFALLSSVTALSKSELDRQQALIDAAGSSANPFSANAIAANDNQGVIDALGQTNSYLSAILQNQILAIQAGGGGGGDLGGVFSYNQYF